MKIDQLTSPAVKQLLRETDPTAVLPTGSTEQHGNHLPLKTDIFLTEQVVMAACEAGKALSLPPVAYGYNEKELCFPGTVSLSARTFLAVIEDIGRSLHRSGWRRLLIVNGHGWNNDLIRAATHILNELRGFTAACCSYWAFCSEEVALSRQSVSPGGMAHAGEFETSLMMYLCPDAVHTENMTDEISYKKSKYHHHDLFNKSPVSIPEPFEKLSSSGVIGTPGLASAEKGKQWFHTVVKKLSDFLLSFRTLYPANPSASPDCPAE